MRTMQLVAPTGKARSLRKKRIGHGLCPEVLPLEGRVLLALDAPKITLEVKALTDGLDELYITTDGAQSYLQWHHLSKAAPRPA